MIPNSLCQHCCTTPHPIVHQLFPDSLPTSSTYFRQPLQPFIILSLNLGEFLCYIIREQYNLESQLFILLACALIDFYLQVLDFA